MAQTPLEIYYRNPEESICNGDNRGNSLDSRSGEIGLVDIEDIKGKAVLRLYPFSKDGKIKIIRGEKNERNNIIWRMLLGSRRILL